MNLQSVGFTGAQVLTASNTTYALSTPTLLNQRNVFRKVFGLRINTGGLANQIRFDAETAHLAIEFDSKQFDIAGTSAVNVTTKSGALAIELPVPMQLHRVRLSGSAAATLEIYRLDGDEVAKDATKTAINTPTSGVLSGDFTDRRFAVKQRLPDASYASLGSDDLKDLVVTGFPTAPRVGIAPFVEGADTPFFFFNPGGIVGVDANGPSGSADVGPQLAEALQQQIDSLEGPYPEHIDVYLVFESDAPCEVIVKSFVVPVLLVRNSFRAVLFEPEDFIDAASFATRLQEHSNPLTAFLRDKLTANTRQAIDRAGKSVADRVLEWIARDLNVALQSEAFYTAQRFQGITLTPETLAAAQGNPTGVARTRVNRSLLEEAFPKEIAPVPEPGDDEKEVLRAEGATSTIDFTVDFPRGAIVMHATLQLEGDLRGDAPPDVTGNNGNGTNPSVDWHDAIPDTLGLGVDTTRNVARLIAPDTAVNASGIALALSATAASAELTAELRADDQNTPAGRVIASGKTTIAQLDQPAWVRFEFKKPTVVEAKPYWLVLRVTDGSVVWLAENEGATTRVGDSAEKGWVDRGGFDAIAPLFQVWARGSNGAAASQGSDEDQLAARMRVTIGGASVAPQPALEGKKRVANITSALQAWLAAQPSSPAIVAVPFRVSALGKGSVTVYPPEIEYSA